MPQAPGSLRVPAPGEIWLAGWMHSLPAEAGERVMARLNLPQRRAEIVREARKVLAALATMPPEARASQVVQRLEEYSLPTLALAYVVGEHDLARAHIARYVEQLRQVRPNADGQTLRARGFPPGPAYRAILRELRAAWLDGEVHNAAEESAWLERRLASEPTGAAA
jgi:tRNA nucleotidyltransferase (CCA-adding enzyme)